MTSIPAKNPVRFRNFVVNVRLLWKARSNRRQRRRQMCGIADLGDHLRRDIGVPELDAAARAMSKAAIHYGW